MREFYRRHRGLHRWLLAVVSLLAVYFALRPVPGLMNWLSRHVIMPWERAVASVCYLFRTSIAEVLYIVLLSVAIFYVANVLRRMVTQPHRGRTLYRFFLPPAGEGRAGGQALSQAADAAGAGRPGDTGAGPAAAGEVPGADGEAVHGG